VTLVPLIHCLGHAGHWLRLDPYKPLREDPRYLEQACPSLQEVRADETVQADTSGLHVQDVVTGKGYPSA
jgi:hypothetical protein